MHEPASTSSHNTRAYTRNVCFSIYLRLPLTMASICLSGLQYQFACVFFCSVQAENIISEFQCSSMLQINNILWSMLLHCVCKLDSVCVRFFPWALQLPYVFRFNGMRFRQKSEDAHCIQQFHFRMSCTDVSILFLFSVPLSGCTVVRVFILPTHVA